MEGIREGMESLARSGQRLVAASSRDAGKTRLHGIWRIAFEGCIHHGLAAVPILWRAHVGRRSWQDQEKTAMQDPT